MTQRDSKRRSRAGAGRPPAAGEWRDLEALEPRLLLDVQPAGDPPQPPLLAATAADFDWSATPIAVILGGPTGTSGAMVIGSNSIGASTLHFGGETLVYSVQVDPGQTLRATAAYPTSTLDVALAVMAPDGTVLAVADQGGAGAAEVLQMPGLTVSGRYLVAATSRGSVGQFTLSISLNDFAQDAAGGSNDSLEHAIDMTPSFIPLGGGAERGIVNGAGAAASLPPVLAEDFEGGALGPAWTTYSSDPNGVVAATKISEMYGQTPFGVLKMSRTANPATPTLNEAVWTADLSGLTEAWLSFRTEGYYDTPQAFNGDFVGHANADGIAISDDGVHWHPIWTGGYTTSNYWTNGVVDLAAAAADAGMKLGPNFRIKFQDLDATTDGGDYRAWDDVRVYGKVQDWYRFQLSAGDSAELLLTGAGNQAARLALYGSDGTLLAAGRPVAGYFSSNYYSGMIEDFIAPATGTYYVEVSSLAGCTLLVTRNAGFDILPHVQGTDPGVSMRLPVSGMVFGCHTTDAGTPDHFMMSANAGDTLTITTTLPDDGPYDYANALDPKVELWGPAGTKVAENDNANSSDLNVFLTYAVPVTGTYEVRVREATYHGGFYVLRVTGSTAALPAFRVTASTPADQAEPATPVSRITLDFSDLLDASSLSAADFLVDGSPVSGCRLVDGDTVDLNFAVPLGEGPHQVAIAAGALRDVQGTLLQAWSARFTVNSIPPKVVSSSVQEGDVVPAGDLTYVARFSKAINAANLDATDFSLVGALAGAQAPASWTYDPATFTLTLAYAGLPDDFYTLTLLSGDKRFEDRGGLDLDGEPAGPMPPNVSGDGVPGGNFVLHFATDGYATALGTLQPVAPLGSGIYDRTVTGQVGDGADEDTYWVRLAAGETLTAAVQGGAGLKATALVSDPSNTLRGTATAAAGGAAVVNTVQVGVPGMWFVTVRGADGTAGGYTLRVTVNAAEEVEARGGPANDSAASAQDLTGSFIDLGGGVTRAAARGSQPVLGSENFEAGVLGAGWTTYAEGGATAQVMNWTSHGGIYALSLNGSSPAALSEATWALDLHGAAPGTLSFWDRRRLDDYNPFSGIFTGHYQADGIAVSVDGATWLPVFDTANTPDGKWAYYEIDLGAALAAAGLAPGATLYVRFQQIGQYMYGHMYDDLRVTARAEDWYQFQLQAGDKAAVAVAGNGLHAGVELHGPDGRIVAIGAPGSGPAVAEIENLAVTAGGTYYARVTGDGDYALVVTRGAAFDMGEDLGLASKARDIGPTGAVLGSAMAAPPAITAESEPNDDGLSAAYVNDFPFADDLSGSFVSAGANAWRAVVSGYVTSTASYQDDFFKFCARPGDSVSITMAGNGPIVGLYDSAGQQLAYNYTSGSSMTISYGSFAAAGTYYIYTSAQYNQGGNYTLTVNLTAPLPYIPNHDAFYTIPVQAGDRLQVSTSTPFAAGATPRSNLDPYLELYDPSGARVAANDNGAGDGRNASLAYTALATGTYTVHVLPTSGSGEYILTARGYTGAAAALTVAAVTPANLAKLTAVPGQVQVDFSSPVQFPSINLAAVTVDGVPVVGWAAVDADTVQFLPAPGLSDGVHSFVIGAGAVRSVSGASVGVFTSQFTLDLTPPRVVATSVAPGDVVAPGVLVYTARFSEPLIAANLDKTDFVLTGRTRGKIDATSFTYDAVTSTLAITFPALADDLYTLTLLSGDTRLEDLFGNDLDGEMAGPLPPQGSGNGVPGGDFTVPFSVDPSAAAPLPAFAPVAGIGSLVYSTGLAAAIGTTADTDAYTAALDAGQLLSVSVSGRAGLRPSVAVYGPDAALVASVVAAAPGRDALLQAVPVGSGGTWTIVVSGADATVGAYDLKVLLNAVFEADEHNGPASNTPASAQDLDTSFVGLGAGADVAAVVGALPVRDGAVIAPTADEGTVIDGEWTTYAFGPNVTATVSATAGARTVTLSMPAASVPTYAEAVWSVDLSAAARPVLTFSWAASYGIADAFTGPFTGRVLADGVAVSPDGFTWYPLYSGPYSYNGTTVCFDLAAFAQASGFSLGAGVQIKFQSYEFSQQIGTRTVSNIRLLDMVSARHLADEGFESGSLGPAWTTTLSSPAGQAYVSGQFGAGDGSYALVMDGRVTTADDHIQAVWQPGLAGATQARLRYWQKTVGSSASQYIYISDDGVRWVQISSPLYTSFGTGGWTEYVFDLSAAAAAQNMLLGPSFRIRFEGVESAGTTAGAEILWDKIAIESGEDWYRFSLAAGEAATVTLDNIAGANTDLALFDAGGRLLALGGPYATTADEAIADFVAPAAGTYFVRVSGQDAADYRLIVARGASLESEPKGNDNLDAPATAQDITPSGAVLGYLQRKMDRLFVKDLDSGKVLELDPLTGAILLSYSAATYEYNYFGMAATRSTLIEGGNDVLWVEVDPNTGTALRSITNIGMIASGAAFMNNEIFGLSNSSNDPIRVYDYVTGALKRSLVVPQMAYSNALGSTGTSLLGMSGTKLYNIDPMTGAATLLGTLSLQAGSGSNGLGVLGNELFVADSFYQVEVFDLATLAFKRTLKPGAGYLSAIGADGGLAGQDYYSVQARAGDTLSLATSTPADGPYAFANTLDPVIELYDPSGALVASNDNGAADGRNARLTWTAATDGTYAVRVTNVSGSGQYVLSVTGYSGAPAPFHVASTDLADGTMLATLPTRVTVNFDGAALMSSITPGSLTVDGLPATGLTVVDADSVRFDLPAGLADGTHTIALAAGAATDLHGTPLQVFSSRFTMDARSPRVVSSSIQDGSTVAAGHVVATIRFNEAMLTTNLDAADFSLLNQYHVSIQPATWAYDAAAFTLTLDYANLPEGTYTLTLTSADKAFEDLVGHNLDGEALAWPIPTNVSGNGVEGGNFVVTFRTDGAIAAMPAFTAVEPMGGLVFASLVAADIGVPGDEDVYEIPLEANQSLAVTVDADASLRVDVVLVGPDNVTASGAVAALGGQPVVLQAAAIDQAGTWYLRIRGAGGTFGAYTVRATLNAAVEPEAHRGPGDGDLAGAVPLGPSAVDLGGGIDRLAATGAIGTIAIEDFEAGRLGAGWTVNVAAAGAVAKATTDYGTPLGAGALYVNGANGSATWTVDLTGAAGAKLRFWHLDNTNSNSITTPYVFVSGDGTNWRGLWIPYEGYPLDSTTPYGLWFRGLRPLTCFVNDWYGAGGTRTAFCTRR